MGVGVIFVVCVGVVFFVLELLEIGGVLVGMIVCGFMICCGVVLGGKSGLVGVDVGVEVGFFLWVSELSRFCVFFCKVDRLLGIRK